jgi:hypothetical protein
VSATSVKHKERKIFFYTFSTDEDILKEFPVNSALFAIKQPQLVNRIVFYELLPMLSSNGVIAYPHFNKLFMIFDLDPTKVDIFEHINNLLTSFIKDRRLEGLIDYDTITQQNIEYVHLKPDPDKNPSHFIIVRQLIYSFLKRRVLEVIWSQRRGKKGGREGKRRPYIPLSQRKTKSGLRVFLECESLGETSQGEVLICRGIKLLLEVTPKYTGLLWVDLAVETYLMSSTGSKSLSPSEMKTLSSELGLDLYQEFYGKASVSPNVRSNDIERYLAELGFTDAIPIKYYIYSSHSGTFTQVSINFQRVKAT